jgi:lysophospholipase
MFCEFGYFPASDGANLRYAFSCPDSGIDRDAAVLLMGGRAEFIEKHQETMQELCADGYRVYAMDWRGQGLSERLLRERHKGHIECFDQYLEDLHCFLSLEIVADRDGPLIFLAHSMGGHIALRYLVEKKPAVAAAVLVSPMIGIRTTPLPEGLAPWFARMGVLAGLKNRYIPGAGPCAPERKPFANNPLTGDRQRFMDERKKIETEPDLAVGGATFGWLRAACASIRTLGLSRVEEVQTPVLMIGGSRDRVVSVPAMKRLCSRMPDCRCVVLDQARHEILNEKTPIRNLFWQEFGSFVSRVVPQGRKFEEKGG